MGDRRMIHRNEMLMGREMGQITYKLGQALGCNVCGVGKALDIIGQRWGFVPYDWAGEEARRMNHRCKNTTWAQGSAPVAKEAALEITEVEKNKRLAEIEAQFAEWAAVNTEAGLM